jgi:signal transduction histidine kinase
MEEPFLAEEQHLIVGVARELNSIIERKYAEEEKLQLREQVRHANRMVTIGQLAAGVAHELNEPLGNILGFAQLAISSPNLNDQTRRDIEKIEKASLYAREIIRKLMFFSRQTPSRKIDVSLQAVVEDALSLLESRCDTAGIELVRNLAPELPLIHGDPAQLQQVLVNLAVNAIQSMPNGGTLTITTRQEQDTQCLVVEDSGSGIAPDDIKNLFLPFFTTKEVGEGTGLGLSVVHGIVSSHGGSVHVESQLGSGTRFEVRLPVNVSDPGNGDGDGK